jgi:hypothetical protein
MQGLPNNRFTDGRIYVGLASFARSPWAGLEQMSGSGREFAKGDFHPGDFVPSVVDNQIRLAL